MILKFLHWNDTDIKMLKTYYFVRLVCSFLIFFTDHARCESDYTFNLKAGGWLKLYSEPETWEAAFSRCYKDGAVLASPLNKELANALQLQMAQFDVTGNIFIGTHDLFGKGIFTSVEGVKLSDMDTRIQYGNGADTGDCVSMSADGSAYTRTSCEDSLPFICYKKLGNQTVNECGTFDNEYHLNQQTGSCYKIHLDKLSWTRAYSICESEGAYLVVLNDENEARIVKNMFPAPPPNVNPYFGFHVGLVALGNERIWVTIHGDKIDNVFNKWYFNEPNNKFGQQVRGVYLWSGKLDDIMNEQELHVFACEKSPKPEQYKHLSEFNDHARCKSDYTFNLKAGGWLKLYSAPEAWEAAFSRCYKDGAVLASPLNKDLANALQLQMVQFDVNGNIFIGTHDLFGKGIFTSVEGVKLSDMDTRLQYDNGADTGDCVSMSADGSAYIRTSCKDPLPFICYKKLGHQTVNECGTFDNEYHLNQQTGSCYKIHLDKLSWTRAYSICESEGAHLVVLNDENEARIVKNMFPAPPPNVDPYFGFHVGLVALGNERIWFTIHGDKIDNVFNKWYVNEPSNKFGKQVRGLYLWSGYLDDIMNEQELHAFACEKSPKPEQYKDLSECNVKCIV